MNLYLPEGFTTSGGYTPVFLEKARVSGKILEGKVVLCDNDHNLYVDLGCMRGLIKRDAAAIGVKEGAVRDIAVLSRVNKQSCFVVEGFMNVNGERIAVCNREKAQREALGYFLETLCPGDIINAKITHLERFGAFADIGCGNVGLINIENISVSRISHPKDRFYVGQRIKTVIKSIDKEAERFTLSHKELLGTWEENAAQFTVGQTVSGIIRSIEEYGVFVELTPNLAGLAEIKNIPFEIREGDICTVYIKNIIPDKMKIKLNLIDCFPFSGERVSEYKYFIDKGNIKNFVYSPAAAMKRVSTEFMSC